MLEYRDLEINLRNEAQAIKTRGEAWSAKEAAASLEKIADELAKIRHQHETGINASMGKRSGTEPDNL